MANKYEVISDLHDPLSVMIYGACFLPRRGEYIKLSWNRSDVKGTSYRLTAPPLTSELGQDNISFFARGGEEYFMEEVRFSGW